MSSMFWVPEKSKLIPDGVFTKKLLPEDESRPSVYDPKLDAILHEKIEAALAEDGPNAKFLMVGYIPMLLRVSVLLKQHGVADRMWVWDLRAGHARPLETRDVL